MHEKGRESEREEVFDRHKRTLLRVTRIHWKQLLLDFLQSVVINHVSHHGNKASFAELKQVNYLEARMKPFSVSPFTSAIN